MDDLVKVNIHYSKPKRFRPAAEVVSCYCSCYNKVLFIRAAERKDYSGCWGVPAGKVEGKDENLEKALIREVFEETALDLKKNSFVKVGTLYVRHPNYDFSYHLFGSFFDKIPEIQLSEEHTEFNWLTKDEIKDFPLIPGAWEALEFFLAWKEGASK